MLKRIIHSLLLFFIIVGSVRCSEGGDQHCKDKQSNGRFLIVWFDQVADKISKQGKLSHKNFQRLFLEPYAIEGERFRPKEGAEVVGLLIGHDSGNAISVPIWKWKINKKNFFLCQASDDGEPPMVSVFANERDKLIVKIVKTMKTGGR